MGIQKERLIMDCKIFPWTGKYSILSPEKNQKIWMKGVSGIVDILKRPNLSANDIFTIYFTTKNFLTHKNEAEKMDFSKTVLSFIKNENIIKKVDLTLMAIAMFVMREESRWKGFKRSAIKVIRGGTFLMDNFFERDEVSICIDNAMVAKWLAHEFEIEGDVIFDTFIDSLCHAHFRAKEGQIIDTHIGFKRGGFFQNEQEYKEVLFNKKGYRLLSGIRPIISRSKKL